MEEVDSITIGLQIEFNDKVNLCFYEHHKAASTYNKLDLIKLIENAVKNSKDNIVNLIDIAYNSLEETNINDEKEYIKITFINKLGDFELKRNISFTNQALWENKDNVFNFALTTNCKNILESDKI